MKSKKFFNNFRKIKIDKFDSKILIVAIIISFSGLFITFILGFHSFDMSQNMMFIRNNLKFELLENGITPESTYYETNIAGDRTTFETTYAQGIKSLIIGIFITIFGTTLIGYAIGKLEK